MTESASARLATPVVIKPEDITNNALGYNPRERSWNYLTPWMGGTWRLRDIIDYQEVAWDSILYQAAVKRSDLLRYFYTINKDNVERTTPNAFVVPVAQNDPGAAKKMLETLAFGDIEIQRASDNFTADGKSFAAGSYVIRMHQPFSGWAKTLLEVQHYPDLRLYPGGPPKRPYDVTAQTLPMLMGVDVATIKDSFTASLKSVTQYSFELDHPKPPGGFPATDVYSWKEVTKIWKSGKSVYRDTSIGDFYASAGSGRKEISAPRIGIYQSYNRSMDEGWTRWLFDDFGFAHTALHNADIQAGSLRQKFYTIIIPDQQRGQIVNGHRAGTMPPEYCGGIGDKGAAALKEFVEQGGTLILFNHASDYATQDLGVKAKNVLTGVPNRDFYSPGSLRSWSRQEPWSSTSYPRLILETLRRRAFRSSP